MVFIPSRMKLTVFVGYSRRMNTSGRTRCWKEHERLTVIVPGLELRGEWPEPGALIA
jgi:hypothetical protein